VVVVYIEDVSEIHAASAFSVEACRLVGYCGYLASGLQKELKIK
jgi:hypothetical protein